ncbi:MAG: PAS domain S-box protein, partial [Proteobacteria bacterium]|nr:PAS domain S-box protein [Pseudomonadota bacterium]
MNPQEAGRPAAGQTQRLAGASRDASLHDQLYRYAQDMQELLENHNQLEQRYRTLSESYASLAEGRTVLEGLIHASRDIYLMTDRKGTILRCNPAAEAIAPLSQLLGAYTADLLEPAHLQHLELLLEALQQGGEAPAHGLELNIHAGGASTLIASVSPMPARVNGDLRGIHWMIRDVTQEREAEFESRISSLVLSNAVEGVMITDCNGDILAVNPAFTRITGYSAEEAVGFLQSGLQDKAFYEKMWDALRSEGRWQGQVTNRKKNGELYTEWMALTSAKDAEGKVLSYIAVFSDLTPLAQAEKRLFHLAYHDALTDLPNRQLLQDRLQQMIGLAERRGETFSVLLVNGAEGDCRAPERIDARGRYGRAAGQRPFRHPRAQSCARSRHRSRRRQDRQRAQGSPVDRRARVHHRRQHRLRAVSGSRQGRGVAAQARGRGDVPGQAVGRQWPCDLPGRASVCFARRQLRPMSRRAGPAAQTYASPTEKAPMTNLNFLRPRHWLALLAPAVICSAQAAAPVVLGISAEYSMKNSLAAQSIEKGVKLA